MLAAMRRASSLVSKLTADRLQALGIEVLRKGLRLAEQIRQLGEFRSHV
jgi:ribosomal protein L9